MKRVLSLLAALWLMLLPLTALAAHFPEAENVADPGAVLSLETEKDLETLITRVRKASGIGVHVAVVRFLDGMDAQTYAERLFGRWKLGESDLIVVFSTVEEKSAVFSGSKARKLLGNAPHDLLYTTPGLDEAIAGHDFNAAVSKYFLAFAGQKAFGGKVNTAGLFSSGEETPRPTAKPNEKPKSTRKSSGDSNAAAWIGFLILAAFIISQTRPVRRARANRAYSFKSYGCGCSPLGWFLSLFGLTALIDRILNNRRGPQA